MTYIGIDPGQDGGVAIIDNGVVTVYRYDEKSFIDDMRCIEMDMHGYRQEKAIACVELVHAMPKQGVSSTFKFGKTAGILEGVLKAYHIPYELVTPQKWKKEFSVTGDKNSSIAVCQRLFPEVSLLATERSRKAHDGMAEALLMAEYARRRMKGE